MRFARDLSASSFHGDAASGAFSCGTPSNHPPPAKNLSSTSGVLHSRPDNCSWLTSTASLPHWCICTSLLRPIARLRLTVADFEPGKLFRQTAARANLSRGSLDMSPVRLASTDAMRPIFGACYGRVAVIRSFSNVSRHSRRASRSSFGLMQTTLSVIGLSCRSII